MAITSEILKSLVEAELATVADPRVVARIRGMLVEPRAELYDWDYGEPGQQYPCWVVLSETIVYCEYGFGPRCPWGLIDSEKSRRIGMDSGWHTTLLDAFFGSWASTELPIWRVFKEESD